MSLSLAGKSIHSVSLVWTLTLLWVSSSVLEPSGLWGAEGVHVGLNGCQGEVVLVSLEGWG